MTIENEIKDRLKDKALSKWERTFLKVILGEFNRIDDAKPCNDTQCMAVVKKLIKNSNIVLENKVDDTNAVREIEFLNQFLPKIATKENMRFAINYIKSKIQDYKNIMQLMKPCIIFLEENGFDVDKKELSTLLGG